MIFLFLVSEFLAPWGGGKEIQTSDLRFIRHGPKLIVWSLGVNKLT